MLIWLEPFLALGSSVRLHLKVDADITLSLVKVEIADLEFHAMLEHQIDALLMLPFSLLLSFSALSCLLLSAHFGLLVIAALLFEFVEKKLAIFIESKFEVGGKLGLFAHLALNLLLRLHTGHDNPALELLAAHAPHFTRLVVLVWHGGGLAHSGHFCRAHI